MCYHLGGKAVPISGAARGLGAETARLTVEAGDGDGCAVMEQFVRSVVTGYLDREPIRPMCNDIHYVKDMQ